MEKPLPITVYEHDVLKVDQQGFQEEHLLALQCFHGDKGTPYFSLVHRGVKFCEYVGVLKVGKIHIEILPKADRASHSEHGVWRDLLIHMLKKVGTFNIHAPSQASLSLKCNSILELYFLLFVQEVEKLVYQGLIKQYHKTEGNRNALKGSLHFPKHIQQNLVHQEQFYVRHTTYSQENLFNQLLLKGLRLLATLNSNTSLSSRISNLLLNFPEVKDIKVSDKTFEKLSFNRKTDSYRNALGIAKLLLLNYHPDLAAGRNHVLALLFDMNLLWERYITSLLRKSTEGKWKVKAQNSKGYWKHEASTHARKLRPDILLQELQSDNDAFKNIVIDTKWKVIKDLRPADSDLRQMFAYCHYFSAERSFLIYPTASGKFKILSGSFLQPHGGYCCGIIQVPVNQIRDKILGETLFQVLHSSNHKAITS